MGDWRIGNLEDLRLNLNFSRFGDWGIGKKGHAGFGAWNILIFWDLRVLGLKDTMI